MSIVVWIIAINAAVFMVQCVWTRPLSITNLRNHPPIATEQGEDFESQLAEFGPRVPVLNDWFSLDPHAVFRGQIWRLFTYDLLHDTSGQTPYHLIGNMYLLFLLGAKVVDVYSEREFALMYIVSAAASGLVYLLWGLVTGESHPAIGASGAVSAVLVIYAMRWPNDVWNIFYIIPMRAKWMAILYAALDLYPMLKQIGGHRDFSGVAHSAHIGGMLFGFLYEHYHWNIESLIDRFAISNPFKRRPKLRIVRDESSSSHPEPRSRRNEVQLKARMDELLAKISEHGQASLTESEQAELNEASRYLRERR